MRLILFTTLLVSAPLFAQPTPIPGDPQDWMTLGIQSYRSQNYSAAVLNFQRAADMDPGNPVAHLYLATSYMVQFIPGSDAPENIAKAERAKSEFEFTLRLDPNNLTAIVSLASLTYQRATGVQDQDAKIRVLDEARQWYQKAVGIDPRNKESWYSMAVIDWLKWYPALMSARTNLGMKPEDPGPLPSPSVRAELLLKYGSIIEDGISNLNHALDIDPNYDDAMAYMNLFVRERADLRDTEDQYKQDVAEADQLVQKALEIKKAKSEGMVAPPIRRSSGLPGGQAVGSTTPQRIRVGTGMAGKLRIHVDPTYPPLAVQARVQGTVRFTATIGRDGRVIDLRLVSGHPLLVQAAKDAVQQWVYSPTLLNGNPVEVVTAIEVPFVLAN